MAETGRSEHGPDITVRRVHGDGVWARVSSAGEAGERAFVLVSGIGVSSHYFEQLAPHLLQFGPVHALDLPGFGGVPHARHALSIAQFADLVAKAVEELGLEDPVIVGHSMGTQICTELAASRPQLSTLVLISPVIEATARSVPVQAFRFLRAGLREPFRVKLLAVVAYLTCGFGWFLKILPRMMSYRIEEAAPRVRASTLIIRGAHDAVCPRPWVAQLGRTFPAAAGVVEIEGAAHSVMHAHAREVAGLCVRHATGEPAALAVTADDDDAGDRAPSACATAVDDAGDRAPSACATAADDAGDRAPSVATAADDDGTAIAVVPELPKEDADLDAAEAARAVMDEVEGVAIEFRGNASSDDRLVERGREQQAEARSRGRA